MPELKGKCWNCGKVWAEDELDEIHDFWGRVSAGEEMPLGQCPDAECGMLCHLMKEPHKIVVSVRGGLVQNVSDIPDGMVVEVHDFDVEGAHGETCRTSEGLEYNLSSWNS